MAENMKWIHCNRCFTLLAEKTTKLFLSNCQHILCTSCIIKEPTIKKIKCAICSVYVSVVRIDRQMPDKLKLYFHPKPWEKTKSWPGIVEFQIKQKSRNRRYILKVEPEAEKEDGNITQRKDDAKQLIRERNDIRRRMASLAPLFRQCKENCKNIMACGSNTSRMEMDSGIGDSFIST